MATLTKIGNSYGVRIPKELIKQAKLENNEINIKATPKGLLLTPLKSNPRAGWSEQIQKIQAANRHRKDEGLLLWALNHEDDVPDWEW